MTHRPDDLGVAVIGTGKMGADHVRRIEETVSGARVTAVVDVDRGRAAAVASRIDGCAVHTDPAAAMASPDVDAVIVASPGPAHEAALMAAFAHDLPVLCEKPLTPDPAAALRVVEAECSLGRRRIQVGFMRRYDAEYARLKALLDTGRLGRPTPSGDAPDGVRDPQFVVLETDGGAVVDVEIFVNCGFGYQVQAEVVCERGTARVGDGHALVTQTAGHWGGTIAQDYLERFADAYDREVQAWVDATRRGEVTGPSAWDGYAVAAVSAAGVRALTEGGRVPVELAERPALYAT